MQQPTFDPGLTQQYNARLRRAINKDGTFNVRRRGTSWRDTHAYLRMTTISWPVFLAILFGSYFVTNCLFAVCYYALGPNALQGGSEAADAPGRFLKALYFSSHTLTTVGFGSISPYSSAANALAAFEALCGLLGFAVATGLLFSRFSHASAKIAFSERALIAPYQDGRGLEFRVVNRRTNALTELEVTVLLMTVVPAEGGLKREYKQLELERSKVYFFPLTWTVVHPVTPDSPLYHLRPDDLERLQAELLVMIKAWDETFSQSVQQRYSYRYDEIVWGAKFLPAFTINDDGDMELNVHRVGAYETVGNEPDVVAASPGDEGEQTVA